MPEIDCKRMAVHLKRVVDDWKTNRETSWGNADAILIAQGKESEVDGLKITALQFYLLGYEFPNLVMVATERDLFVLVRKKSADKYVWQTVSDVIAGCALLNMFVACNG